MTEEQRKQVLVETVGRFGKQEWFRDAKLYNAHPTTGEATLEIKVNYVPIFERKAVMDFAMAKNITTTFVVVDANGNPTE
jgi:hypothetical protein